MKTLVMVRHAKSSWDSLGLDDFDRPLNDRGKKDAPEMAARLIKKNLKPDLFLSSSAKRAQKTAKYFIKAWGGSKKEIVLLDKLYGAGTTTFFDVIRNLDDQYQSVIIFSHNPGITEFVNLLTDVRTDNMPTCSAFGVQADCENWRSFLTSEKKFLFFEYPKKPAV